MKTIKTLLLLIIAVSITTCSIKNKTFKTNNLSNDIKVLYATKTIDTCHYINVKVINNNVGVCIPLIRDQFLTAVSGDYYISGAWLGDEQDFACDFYPSSAYQYQFNSITKKSRKDDVDFIYSKVSNKIPHKIFIDQVGTIEATLDDFKYYFTYYIDANSYIEIPIPINSVLNENKSINTIKIYEGNNKFRKEAMRDIKIALYYKNDTIKLAIPDYPKKIKNYYLVQDLKIKDTIINLR